jgi:arylsulfatase A-like enzyme
MFFVLAFCLRGYAVARPNIIFILADDLGCGDLSCYGGEIATPHLDRLAREGTRFTQAYSAAPICSPSRAGLITGQHPARWRITSFLQARKGNAACEQEDFLDPAAPSLPRALKAAGYRTAHIGKWHLGGGRDVTNAPPFSAYGYDIGFGTYESPEPHRDITATNWIWSAHDTVKRWERTRWMIDRTLDFLRDAKGKPSFINLWLDDPHTPWVPSQAVASEPPRTREQKANLREVLVEMDGQIGRLVTGIQELGIQTNTIVIFMSDNGPLPTFGQTRANGLRGSKLSLYEGGIRVPLIAWWPGRIPAEQVNDKTVFSGLDVFATLAHLAGAEHLPASDGENLANALFGKSPQRKTALFWEYGRNTNSFAFPNDAFHRSPNIGTREGKWKLLINGDGSGPELYNLDADPRETRDLASSERGRAKRMSESALAWRKLLPIKGSLGSQVDKSAAAP